MKERKDILEAMIRETETAKKYTERALEKIEQGKRDKAVMFSDIVKCASQCAMQNHDELWELVGEDITEEEFKHFCEAETCYMDLQKLEKALRR